MPLFMFCSYDDKGNLFFTGSGLGEMTPGSSMLRRINVNNKSVLGIDSVQWDGKNFAVVSATKERGPLPVYRLEVTGSSAKVVGETKLLSETATTIIFTASNTGFKAMSLLDKISSGGKTRFWRYPAGESRRPLLRMSMHPTGSPSPSPRPVRTHSAIRAGKNHDHKNPRS